MSTTGSGYRAKTLLFYARTFLFCCWLYDN